MVTRNLVFVSTADSTYAVHRGSHQPVWSYPEGGHLAISRDALLLIAGTDGALVAISLR